MSMAPTLPGAWDVLAHRLSPEQEALLTAAADEWAATAVAAGPADREAAEDGVRRAHLAAGLAPPERVLWFGSPLAGAVAAAVVTGLDADLAVRDPVWDRVRAELEAQGWPRVRGRAGRPVRFWVGALVLTEVRVRVRARVGLHLWGQAWDRTGGEVLTRLTDRIWDLQVGELRRRIDPPLGWPATERLRHQAIAGPPEIAWCAEAEGLGRALPHLEATRRLDGLVQGWRRWAGGGRSSGWPSCPSARRCAAATSKAGRMASTGRPWPTRTGSRCTPGTARRSPPS
jgi:hypothetical protein